MVRNNLHRHERFFVYGPGAERAHIEQLLSLRPSSAPQRGPGPVVALFGGPLEEHDGSDDVLAPFLNSTQSVRLPTFEPCEHAFWNMRLYWISG